MNERDLTVYRTTNADVLKRWHETAKAREAWGEQMKAFLAEHGFGKRQVWTINITGYIAGIEHDDGDVPEGWRIDRYGRLVPRRSTKAGKAIAAKLDALRQPDPRASLPGMPGECLVSLALLTCGLRVIDDALFATWSQPIPEERVDLDIWERIKLSEYYAAIEADDEQAEATL
ncbi:hypothetical protein ACIBQX_18925 [Nonomuraea sp. NPDC049714]|uniref:hypothetical protein n=1 Tax=Nonomuraea sp. NPDC049714 TaxID=3364357 RepID=UPI0037B0064E